MPFTFNTKTTFKAEDKTSYTNRIKEIQEAFVPKKSDAQKILNQNPDLNLTSDIESKLIYNAKLQLALSNPRAYFDEKGEKLIELGNQVNAEFVRVFNEVNEYAGKSKAKEMALKSAKNLYEIEIHKIDTEYHIKLDEDLENKLFFELKNKIN